MGIYKTPYTKFHFANKVIDYNLFLFLKNSSKNIIISEMDRFRKNEILEFQSDHKVERISLLIARLLLLYFIISISIVFNFEELNNAFFGVGFLSIFPALFLLSFTFSYALTLRELKKALRERKKNILKAHELAKTSEGFNDFISKITLSKNKS